MIRGWDKAIRTMRVGERAVVRISDPTLAYGEAGFPPLIPPQAEIEVDLEVLDSQPPMANIDFDNLAMADNTPVSLYAPGHQYICPNLFTGCLGDRSLREITNVLCILSVLSSRFLPD
jgi:hypothetical protein